MALRSKVMRTRRLARQVPASWPLAKASVARLPTVESMRVAPTPSPTSNAAT